MAIAIGRLLFVCMFSLLVVLPFGFFCPVPLNETDNFSKPPHPYTKPHNH